MMLTLIHFEKIALKNLGKHIIKLKQKIINILCIRYLEYLNIQICPIISIYKIRISIIKIQNMWYLTLNQKPFKIVCKNLFI